MDYDIFENGISGYAPQGGTGVKGNDGYNFYYSSLSDFDTISKRIVNGKSLTNNENILTNVSYKNNDMILCSNSDMLIVRISDSSTYVEKIGSLIKSKTVSKDSSSGLNNSVEFFIKYKDGNGYQKNEYNYCNNSTTVDAKSPLYHHRSAMHDTEYGFRIYTKNPYQKGDDPKICIQFNNGMRFVSPCNPGNSNDDFFINNDYFSSYGCWEDKEYWEGVTQLTSEQQEFNSNRSEHTKNFLLNDSSICISNGYIETSGMSGKDASGNAYDSSTLYRIPIIFKDDQ